MPDKSGPLLAQLSATLEKDEAQRHALVQKIKVCHCLLCMTRCVTELSTARFLGGSGGGAGGGMSVITFPPPDRMSARQAAALHILLPSASLLLPPLLVAASLSWGPARCLPGLPTRGLAAPPALPPRASWCL